MCVCMLAFLCVYLCGDILQRDCLIMSKQKKKTEAGPLSGLTPSHVVSVCLFAHGVEVEDGEAEGGKRALPVPAQRRGLFHQERWGLGGGSFPRIVSERRGGGRRGFN